MDTRKKKKYIYIYIVPTRGKAIIGMALQAITRHTITITKSNHYYHTKTILVYLVDICEPYLGDVCLEVKGYSGSDVFVRLVKNIHSWENIEEKLSLSLIETRHYYRPTEGCMNIFTVLLCHSAFPHCDEEEPEQLCGAHCQLEESLRLFCPEVYNQFINFQSTNQAIVSNMRCDINETDSQCMQIHSLTTSGKH